MLFIRSQNGQVITSLNEKTIFIKDISSSVHRITDKDYIYGVYETEERATEAMDMLQEAILTDNPQFNTIFRFPED